jgi:hypothetical protein
VAVGLRPDLRRHRRGESTLGGDADRATIGCVDIPTAGAAGSGRIAHPIDRKSASTVPAAARRTSMAAVLKSGWEGPLVSVIGSVAVADDSAKHVPADELSLMRAGFTGEFLETHALC